MSVITFAIGLGIGVLAQYAVDVVGKAAEAWAAFQAWRKFRKP